MDAAIVWSILKPVGLKLGQYATKGVVNAILGKPLENELREVLSRAWNKALDELLTPGEVPHAPEDLHGITVKVGQALTIEGVTEALVVSLFDIDKPFDLTTFPLSAAILAGIDIESAPVSLVSLLAEFRSALREEVNNAAMKHDSALFRLRMVAAAEATQRIEAAIVASNPNGLLVSRARPHEVPPRLLTDAISRERELEEMASLLPFNGRPGLVVTWVHAGPGMGKSTMAALWGSSRTDAYPGGVIWLNLGPTARTTEDGRPACLRLAALATGLSLPELSESVLDPVSIRTELSRLGRMLVVLDDAWAAAPVQSALELLSSGTHVIVTTRLTDLAGDSSMSLGPMDSQDALAVLADIDGLTTADADALASGLGYHPMALRVARGSLAMHLPKERPQMAAEIVKRVHHGTSLGGLSGLRPDEREAEVQAALSVSYEFLVKLAGGRLRQKQFRSLGVFAPNASFDLYSACAVLATDSADAETFLQELCKLGLLDVDVEPEYRYRQHALLRSFCLALLIREGEEQNAVTRYVSWYCRNVLQRALTGDWPPLIPDVDQIAHCLDRIADSNSHDKQRIFTVGGMIEATCELFVSVGRSAQLLDFAERFRNRMTRMGKPEWTILASVAFGTAAWRCSRSSAGDERQALLDEAVKAYRKALVFRTAERSPLEYAATQINLGCILGELAKGLSENDRQARLEEAVTAFREALRYYKPGRAPNDYAITQNNLGNALGDLAMTFAGEERQALLDEAVKAYREALVFRTEERSPLGYAGTQNNLGVTLSEVAKNLPGDKRQALLDEAIEAFREALRFRTSQDTPLDYAMSQNNLGNALRERARGVAGEQREALLEEAVSSYREALHFHTPERAPLEYAMAQNNLSLTLTDLAQVLVGKPRQARLKEAVAACCEALRFYTAARAPIDYAMTQNTLGNAMRAIAEGLPYYERKSTLEEAVRAYREALRFQTAERAPLEYSMTQNNLGSVLRELARGLTGKSRENRLNEARMAYQEALRFYTADGAPLSYAMTQNNLGIVLSDLAQDASGDTRQTRLDEAVKAFRTALRYLTAQLTPLEYAGSQSNLGSALRESAEGFSGDARQVRLEEAAKAYQEGLRFHTAEQTPLQYAGTQAGLGVCLSYLAMSLTGNERQKRLRNAATAYREALRFYTADNTPFEYIGLQRNLSTALMQLAAMLPHDEGIKAEMYAWTALLRGVLVQGGVEPVVADIWEALDDADRLLALAWFHAPRREIKEMLADRRAVLLRGGPSDALWVLSRLNAALGNPRTFVHAAILNVVLTAEVASRGGGDEILSWLENPTRPRSQLDHYIAKRDPLGIRSAALALVVCTPEDPKGWLHLALAESLMNRPAEAGLAVSVFTVSASPAHRAEALATFDRWAEDDPTSVDRMRELADIVGGDAQTRGRNFLHGWRQPRRPDFARRWSDPVLEAEKPRLGLGMLGAAEASCALGRGKRHLKLLCKGSSGTGQRNHSSPVTTFSTLSSRLRRNPRNKEGAGPAGGGAPTPPSSAAPTGAPGRETSGQSCLPLLLRSGRPAPLLNGNAGSLSVNRRRLLKQLRSYRRQACRLTLSLRSGVGRGLPGR